jgi:hypothetical protein
MKVLQTLTVMCLMIITLAAVGAIVPSASAQRPDPPDERIAELGQQSAPFLWHPQSGLSGEVSDSKLTIKRKRHEITFVARTHSLTAGNANTLHAYVFNRPENCTIGNPVFGLRCAPPDLGNPTVEGSLIRVRGEVTDQDGDLQFRASIELNDPSACYPGFPCHGGIQTPAAGILVCIRDHGVALTSSDGGDLAAQLNLFNGGCPPNVCHFAQFVPALAPQQ